MKSEKLKIIGYFYLGRTGFGIIEIIVAMGILVIIAATATSSLLGGLIANRLGDEETEAYLYSQEGIEAVRSIKNQGWNVPFLLRDCRISCGLTNTSSRWSYSGTNNIRDDKFTRTMKVESVNRDGSGNVVETGGTYDPDTKKITAATTWDFSPGGNNNITLTTYFTNFRRGILGNWSSPALQSSVNISGTDNGLKTAVSGNYAYMVRNSGTPDFFIIDISNLASPIAVGSLDLPSSPRDIEVSGNYAYVASIDDASELQIINITTPTAPVLVGSFNALAAANGLAVSVVGTTAYLVRASSVRDELYIINVADPSSPVSLGSLNLGANANEIIVLGNYAYIASANDTQELQIVNISNPSASVQVGSYNSAGTLNGNSVTGFGNIVFLGFLGTGNVEILDVSNPSSPSQIALYSGSDDIRDMTLGNDNQLLFLATDTNASEFQVVDVSTLYLPILLGSYNVSGNNDLNGVAYDSARDRAFAVGDANTAEFIIIQPQ